MKLSLLIVEASCELGTCSQVPTGWVWDLVGRVFFCASVWASLGCGADI